MTDRIISMNGRLPKDKGSDFATKADAIRLAVAEASKAHEFYLNQMPQFVARMIQDALLSYNLIAVPASDIAPEKAPDVSGVPCGTEPTAPDSFETPVIEVEAPK